MPTRRDNLEVLRGVRQQLFERAVRTMEAEARTGGDVDGSLRAIARVDALITAHAKSDNRRWRFVIVALVMVVGVGVLLMSYVHIGSARVELKTATSSVRVQSRLEQRLTDLLSLSDVVVSGPAALDGPSELGFGGDSSQLRLESADSPIVMEPIELPPDAWASLQTAGEPGRYRLTLRFTDVATVSFSLSGKVRAIVDGSDRTAVIATPREVVARWRPGDLAILTFSTKEAILTRPVAIRALDFMRYEIVANYQVPVPAQTGGTLSFTDYQRRELTLPSDVPVTVRGVDGYTRSITAEKSALNVAFHGAVTGLTYGDGASERNQLPTWLDAVTRNTEWLALLSAASAFAATAVGWLKWWRQSE